MKIFIAAILILLTCWVNSFGATGNYWGKYLTDSTYQTMMIHIRPSGITDTATWDNVSEVDTLVSMTNDSVGFHYFVWRFLFVADSSWITVVDPAPNFNSGGSPASGYMRIRYGTELCDSLLYIHEYGGSYDSSLYTAVYGIDTSIACSGLDVGLHNNIVLFFYNGDDRWRSSSELFHNSIYEGIGSGSPELCQVYIDVEDISGNSAPRGILLKGSLIKSARSIVQDTCAHKFIYNLTDKDWTNENGRATIELIRSKCLSNGGRYRFEILNPWTGEYMTKEDSIPDSSSWRLPVGAW